MAVKSFKRYTLNEFVNELQGYRSKVTFSEVHVHHTYVPNKADYEAREDKERFIQAMWRYHTQTRGWQDIAQHATIDPDGYIWEGRSLLVPPASATGYNDSDADGIHPFMFEMIGNFDIGHDQLEGPQLRTALGLTAAVIDIWGLSLDKIRFHREMAAKTCPGTGIDKDTFVTQVNAAWKARRGGTVKMTESKQNKSFPAITKKVSVTLADTNETLTGYVIDGVTYAPVRKIAESMGAKVRWNAESGTVTIEL